MKVKHWLVFLIFAVGALFLWHLVQSHGGTAGLKSGIGIGG